MTAYETLLQKILDEGETRGDRTGTGTISLFGTQMEFDLTEEFPLLTSKKVAWEKVYEELFWFLRGETNILSLLEKGVHIWSEWPYKAYLEKTSQPVPKDKESTEWTEGIKEFEAKILDDVEFARTWGDLGPVYGSQWRKWAGPDGTVIDQIAGVIESIKTNRYSRRHIVSAWNPAEVDQMKLPPCHALFQFYVHTDDTLSCQLYQRSADMFLGVPFNIASYALLTHIIADQCGLKPGKFVWTGGDTHVYLNHLEQSRLQLSREERPLPKLALKDTPDDISRYTGDNLVLLGYHPHPGIKAPIAV